MADFVAVLRKTIDGLGETTPEMRKRVYDKARSTVSAKLAAISPPPPPGVADRQRRSLEDAIAEVERGYAAPFADEEGDPLDRLQNIFPSLGASGSGSRSAYSNPPVASAPPPPVRTAPPPPPPPPPAFEPEADDEMAAASTGPVFAGEAVDDSEPVEAYEVAEREPRRSYTGLIIAAVVLVVLAAGGYAAWTNRAGFQEAFNDAYGRIFGGSEVATVSEGAQVQEDAAAPVETAAAPAPAAAETQAAKFTQRLNSDGSEIDEGPAGGVASVGEGTSVAAATQPPTVPAEPAAPATGDPAAPDAAVTPPAEGAPATPPATAETAPVGAAQKAIYYEERTSTAQGSADTGSIVWSVVQESPGGDLPPEPAIRAEATIPAKNIQLTMTIRRNGDKTLPFSHMIELIFLTPENFDGGGIDNILRFALKESEEAAGSSIRGTPAKIAEGFFLVALNDAPAEVEANLSLMRAQSWIDIPLVYKSGRRALITMEKGAPGGEVFDAVLKSWQTASLN